jgi:hypothetical protein
MTVAAATPRVQYTGNGVTTAFAFSQKVFTLTDILVYREVISTGVTTLVNSSEYTVAGSALATGGYSDATVTFTVAPTTDHKITLVRSTPKAQDTDYVTNAGFPADGHENATDKLVMALQEMVYDISRCIKQNVSANGDLTFPSLIAGFLYSNGSTLEFKTLGDITTVPTYGAAFGYGLDASKAAAPTQGALYLATDTKKFYRCYVNGTWSLDTTFALVTANGLLAAEGTAPSTAAGQLGLYTKDTSGQPEWFYRKESDGTEIQITSNGKLILPLDTTIAPKTSGFIDGGIASNNSGDATNDIDFAALTCRAVSDDADITVAAMTKRVDAAWAVGSAAGGMDTGSVGASPVMVHVFAIKKDSDGVGDIIFTLAAIATGPTMPSGYTKKRYLYSLHWTGSAWELFIMTGRGREKRIEFYAPKEMVNGGTQTSFTDVDASAFCPDGYTKKIFGHFQLSVAGQSAVAAYGRVKGSSTAAGEATVIGRSHDDQMGPGNPEIGGTFEMAVNATGVWQYAVSSGTIEIYTRGYEVAA